MIVQASVSLQRPPNDLLPHAVIELLFRDGYRPAMKFDRVILCVEVLEANDIAFHGHQSCRELFALGALRGVAFHWGKPDFKLQCLQKRLGLRIHALRNVPRMRVGHYRLQGGQLLPSPMPTGTLGQKAETLKRDSNGKLPALTDIGLLSTDLFRCRV
jgi:hypothetical protein